MQPISLNSFLSFKTSASQVKVNHHHPDPFTLACQPTQCNITMRVTAAAAVAVAVAERRCVATEVKYSKLSTIG
jgi:hypothetical protein